MKLPFSEVFLLCSKKGKFEKGKFTKKTSLFQKGRFRKHSIFIYTKLWGPNPFVPKKYTIPTLLWGQFKQSTHWVLLKGKK